MQILVGSLKERADMSFLANLLTASLFHVGPPAADMLSTELVLQEPFMQETRIKPRNTRLATNLALAAGSTLVDLQLQKKKGFWAKAALWGLRAGHVALGIYAVQHNFRELEKAQRARSEMKQWG